MIMKTKLGIVGPKDSVEMIIKIAEKFKDKIIYFPYIYTDVEETAKIVKKGENEVDVWLFSGQAPYTIANKIELSHKAFFPELNGSSLLKTLLDISYKNHKNLDYISLDTIPIDEIHETFSELQLPTADLQILPYSGYRPTEELTSFHYDLFKNNKVDVSITCVHSVYKKLKSLGVPAFRVTPTKMALRQTIKMAYQQNETLYFKRSQIAVLIIQTQDDNNFLKEKKLLAQNHRLNLKLQEMIIDFTEAINGSFVFLGNDKFMIFSTRGSLENHGKYFTTSLLEQITLLTNFTSNMGIGYGKTSSEAEQNAYLALNHARNHEKNCTILVDENGSIEGPLKEPDSITYNYQTEDKELLTLLNKAGVNISTYNKIIYIQNSFTNNTVSTASVSEWLNMTQRNARRILTGLEKEGLAQLIGEEAPSNRGRPRKTYRLTSKTSTEGI